MKIVPQILPLEYSGINALNSSPVFGYRLKPNGDIGEYHFGSNMQAERYTQSIGEHVHAISISKCSRKKLDRAGKWIFRKTQNDLSEEDITLLIAITSRTRIGESRRGLKNMSLKYIAQDKSARLWSGIIERALGKPGSRGDAYKEVTVCEEWKNYDNFKMWYDENYPHHLENRVGRLELDKDLLSENIKIYSPHTCVFLPQCVNSFMTNTKRVNTSGYTGVSKTTKGKWRASITDPRVELRRGNRCLGDFKNIEDAVKAYANARREIAEYYKDYLRDLGYPESIVDKLK
ncbi:MAG: hypothetical protein ACRC7S_17425 [Cetobacterium sp.]